MFGVQTVLEVLCYYVVLNSFVLQATDCVQREGMYCFVSYWSRSDWYRIFRYEKRAGQRRGHLRLWGRAISENHYRFVCVRREAIYLAFHLPRSNLCVCGCRKGERRSKGGVNLLPPSSKIQHTDLVRVWTHGLFIIKSKLISHLII